MKPKTYAIVTPAYNEGAYLERTIEGVLGQTRRPVRWVIVDDGSTDRTPDIVKRYAAEHPWIQHLRRERVPGQAYFASNVEAIMAGYRACPAQETEFFAVLDADIGLPPDYYARMLDAFAADGALGVASGVYENLIDGRLVPVLNDRRSTPKAIQVFRRSCFDDIGGYLPLPHGGEDTCACVMARVRGWHVWSFPDIKVVHYRPTGVGQAGTVLRARFKQGLNEYGLGSHPAFVVVKCLKRAFRESPFLLGGAARLTGFLTGYLRREPRLVPREVQAYYRREQMTRLWRLNRISAPETAERTAGGGSRPRRSDDSPGRAE